MDLINFIKEQGLLFDGAMGTMLFREGLNNRVSDFWNLEKPEIIKKIHQAYFEAGSDIVTTNSFGATKIKLKKAGLESHFEEINRNAVAIAKSAMPEGKFIAGDIGPTGKMLYPLGDTTTHNVYDDFLEQVHILVDEGVDAIIIETMFDFNEMKAAIKAARAATNIPLFATLTFNYSQGTFHTMMGNPVLDSLKEMLDLGADIVGANCSVGSDKMLLLAELLNTHLPYPKIIQPNAGLPEEMNGRLHYPESEDTFADNIMKIKNQNVEVVGGCCGTTPEYIQKIKSMSGIK